MWQFHHLSKCFYLNDSCCSFETEINSHIVFSGVPQRLSSFVCLLFVFGREQVCVMVLNQVLFLTQRFYVSNAHCTKKQDNGTEYRIDTYSNGICLFLLLKQIPSRWAELWYPPYTANSTTSPMADVVLPVKIDFMSPRQAWLCWFSQPAAGPWERKLYQEQGISQALGSNPSSTPS